MDRQLDPCIVFSFSKKLCETYALQMARYAEILLGEGEMRKGEGMNMRERKNEEREGDERRGEERRGEERKKKSEEDEDGEMRGGREGRKENDLFSFISKYLSSTFILTKRSSTHSYLIGLSVSRHQCVMYH